MASEEASIGFVQAQYGEDAFDIFVRGSIAQAHDRRMQQLAGQ